VIQARLGHKSIVETMDTYGHLFPEHLQETAAVLDELYGGAAAL
jgi:integrase